MTCSRNSQDQILACWLWVAVYELNTMEQLALGILCKMTQVPNLRTFRKMISFFRTGGSTVHMVYQWAAKSSLLIRQEWPSSWGNLANVGAPLATTEHLLSTSVDIKWALLFWGRVVPCFWPLNFLLWAYLALTLFYNSHPHLTSQVQALFWEMSIAAFHVCSSMSKVSHGSNILKW